MTATRMLSRAGTLVAAAGLWFLAASFLWRTSVPHHLNPPHLRPTAYFTQAAIHRAEHFSGLLTWLVVGNTVVQLAVLGLVAWYGPRLAAVFAVGRIGKGVLIGCLAGTLLWAVSLPFEAVAIWWERRFGVVHESFWTVLAGSPGTLAGLTIVITLMIVILMALAAWLPRTWWIAAAAALTAVGAVLALIQPLLTFGTHPVRDPEIRASIQTMERREHVVGTRVDVEKVSDQTSLINAYTYGLGPTQRVVLWDTLFDGRLNPREIVVIAAHELGHVRSRHIPKGVAWGGLTALVELLIVAVATRRRGGLAQPGAVPLALVVLSVVSIASSPIYNEVSRRYEAEADWRALNATRDPKSAISLFEQFTRADLSEPRPATWEYLFFEDHPTVLQRIAMARAWQARHGG